MEYYPPSVIRLIQALSNLPGVGQKTATRLALHILRCPAEEVQNLSRCLLDVKQRVRLCSRCFGLSDTDPCPLCTDPNRDQSLLCIVEQPSDIAALEKSGAFHGVYHVLHGVLAPIDGIGPEELRVRELVARLSDGRIREVLLATNTNVEGEATASYLSQLLARFSVNVTRIASGVPMGSDLKYLDEVTIRRAIERRQRLHGD